MFIVTDLMGLVERLADLEYTVVRKSPTVWQILEEPFFYIRIHTLPATNGTFIAKYTFKDKVLTLDDWLGNLEAIAMIKHGLGEYL